MSVGKIASQAGHAYVGAIELARQSAPSMLSEYHSDFPKSPGTKICLACPDESAILAAYQKATEAGLPAFLVVDSGCPNFFGGQPIITALGIGPAKRAQVANITNKFKLQQ